MFMMMKRGVSAKRVAKDFASHGIVHPGISIRLVMLSRIVHPTYISKQRKFKKAGIGNDGIHVYVCLCMVLMY